MRERGGSHFEDWELHFPFSFIHCERCLRPLPPPLLLFFLLSAPLLTPALSQLPPWGLSSPSPSPPPSLPTFPGPSWEPLGCCAAGGCLAGSLHRHPRHLRSCWEYEEERWSVRIVQSVPNRCLTLRGRSSRTRGDMSTRTARTWGCPC